MECAVWCVDSYSTHAHDCRTLIIICLSGALSPLFIYLLAYIFICIISIRWNDFLFYLWAWFWGESGRTFIFWWEQSLIQNRPIPRSLPLSVCLFLSVHQMASLPLSLPISLTLCHCLSLCVSVSLLLCVFQSLSVNVSVSPFSSFNSFSAIHSWHTFDWIFISRIVSLLLLFFIILESESTSVNAL